MKPLIFIALGLITVIVVGGLFFFRSVMAGGPQAPTTPGEGSLWDLETRTLEGEPAPLGAYRGQVALVVNTASKCGLTPQYEGLEALYRELKDRGFVILGFPSNDFMGQEPGTAEEIRSFCTTRFQVSFPMFEKVKVKGEQKDPVYRLLTAGGLEDPTWNFTKFLVGKDGKVMARFAPKTAPDDPGLREAILAALD